MASSRFSTRRPSHELFEGRLPQGLGHQPVQTGLDGLFLRWRIVHEGDAHPGGKVLAGLPGLHDPPNDSPKDQRLSESGGADGEAQHRSHFERTMRSDECPTSADVVRVVRQQGVEAIIFDGQLDRRPGGFSTIAVLG